MIDFIKKHLLKLLIFLILLGGKCPCCGGGILSCASSLSIFGLAGLMLVTIKDLAWKIFSRN